MIKFKTCAFITLLIMLLGIGGAAWGRTADDNTIAGATTIGPGDTVYGSVGPKDEVDYYTLDIAPGSKVSGSITLQSPQEGTSLRITGNRYTVFAKRTTDEELKLVYTVPEEGVEAGLYYIRVGYHPSYNYDHEYTLTLDLVITGPPEVEAELPVTSILEQFPGQTVPPLLEIQPTVPWPSRRGCASNRGRSTYNGPPGQAYKSIEFNVLQDTGLGGGTVESRFNGLVAGTNDRIYFAERGAMFAAYDISSGLVRFEILGWLPFLLDGDNNVYITDFYERRISCMDINGNELWYLQPPGDITTKLQVVGRRVYTFQGAGWDDNWASAWDKNGDPVWSVGPLLSGVIGMAEDANVCTYYHTQGGLFQYDWDGNSTWFFEFEQTPEWMQLEAISLGVVVGRDHRVMVHDPWGKRLCIFNPDGTMYGELDYTNEPADAPLRVCFGGNGNLYVATKGHGVVCYDNWTTELWRVPIAGASGIEDMIMGQDDTIYVLYNSIPTLAALIFTHHWVSLDPDTGAQIFDMNIQAPAQFNPITRGELAIGENNKLLYLNYGGYIAVFEPTIQRFAPDIKFDHMKIRETGG